MKFRKSVFIVVYSKHKKEIQYLILKRKLHWNGWEFPKGGVEFSESEKTAVRREIKEETGLKIIKIKKFNIKGKFRYNKKLLDRPGFSGQEYSLYAVEVEKAKVKIDKREHSGYKWTGFNDAVKKLKWKNQRKCLEVVDKCLGK